MQAASPPPPSDKASWRRWFRDRIRGYPDLESASSAIVSHLADHLKTRSSLKIATFAALPGEPDLSPLLASGSGHHWHFPRVAGDDLVFHRIEQLAELVPGNYGISEPADEAPAVDASEFDLILCPGLGFGRDGSRLGRGKGYYDRTLAACRPDARVIGIVLPCQLVDTVPTETHDRFMDGMATVEQFTLGDD